VSDEITVQVCGGKQVTQCPSHSDGKHVFDGCVEVAERTFSSVCKCGMDAFTVSLWEGP
jgi:hypothetical protein